MNKPYEVKELNGLVIVEYSCDCELHHLNKESDLLYIPLGYKVDKINGLTYISYPEPKVEKPLTIVETLCYLGMMVSFLGLCFTLLHGNFHSN